MIQLFSPIYEIKMYFFHCVVGNDNLFPFDSRKVRRQCYRCASLVFHLSVLVSPPDLWTFCAPRRWIGSLHESESTSSIPACSSIVAGGKNFGKNSKVSGNASESFAASASFRESRCEWCWFFCKILGILSRCSIHLTLGFLVYYSSMKMKCYSFFC